MTKRKEFERGQIPYPNRVRRPQTPVDVQKIVGVRPPSSWAFIFSEDSFQFEQIMSRISQRHPQKKTTAFCFGLFLSDVLMSCRALRSSLSTRQQQPSTISSGIPVFRLKRPVSAICPYRHPAR